MRLFLLCMVFIGSLSAGSLRLMNDSAYPLRAVMRGADGTYLGEVLINPQQSMAWNENNTNSGTMYFPSKSMTPYTVTWYCAQGGNFSVCENVNTGATVTAMSCTGTKACQKKKGAPNPNGEKETEEYLYPQAPQKYPQGVGPPGSGTYGPP